MKQVFEHCLAQAPREAVGLVLRGPGGRFAVAPLTNVSPTPTTAFEVSAAEWMRLESEVLNDGAEFYALYHSHLDAPAVLSRADQVALAPGKAPLISGLRVWVISVRGGLISQVGCYSWLGDRYVLQQESTHEIESVLFRKGCFRL
jgi:proteasome lid subunit RPN8/RPN11